MILVRDQKMRKVVLFWLGMLFVLLAENATAGSNVQALRFVDEADHTRVVFDLSSAVTRKVFLLDNPKRVVIDLKNTRLRTQIKQPDASHPLFRRIRHAPRNKTDLRVVVDLKKKVKPNSFVLKPSQDYGHRLVLDLYDFGGLAGALKKSRKKNVQPPVKKIPATVNVVKKAKQPKPNIKTVALPQRQSETLETEQQATHETKIELAELPAKPRMTSSSRTSNEFVVAIDAGHGGNDPGARGAHGTREKIVVLSIAKKLDRLIAREPGMRSVLIRKGDYYVGLRQRMSIARKADADIFVSIHADAFRKSNIRGSSVYTLSQRGASSEAARWLAAKQNESYQVGGVNLDDKDKMLAGVLLDLSQTATQDASTDVAAKVLRNLRKLGRVHKRKVQSAGFVVLKSPDIPSILVETAFISNPAEEKNLKSPSYQNKIARAIFKGIRDYYHLRAAPAMHMASRKHVISPGETLSGIAQMYGVSTRQLQTVNTLRTTRIKIGQVLEIPTGS